MEWHKLTRKTMPPEETSILLWLDYSHDGFPVCGVCSCGEITYASNWNGITGLDKSEWRRTLWALIKPPTGEEKGGEKMEPIKQMTRENQKIFIQRERIRRELMKVKPNETICLSGEQVQILLKWIKELEERRF